MILFLKRQKNLSVPRTVPYVIAAREQFSRLPGERDLPVSFLLLLFCYYKHCKFSESTKISDASSGSHQKRWSLWLP